MKLNLNLLIKFEIQVKVKRKALLEEILSVLTSSSRDNIVRVNHCIRSIVYVGGWCFITVL